MSRDEVRALLDEERVVTVATTNPDGRIHLVPLWFVYLATGLGPFISVWLDRKASSALCRS